MDLSIIIVNWNSAAYLRKCLATLYETTYGINFEVIVIDNASFDGSGKMLDCQFKQVKFIQSEANLGFAGANNIAFAQSSGRNLLFLNPDTEVIGSALRAMLTVLENVPDAGVIGAKLLNSDGSIQTSCIQRFPSIINQAFDADILRNTFPTLRFWGTRPFLEKQQGPVSVDVVSGACMMVRRKVFEQVGMFSMDYFMYAEDCDLCFKVEQAGLKNYYVDEAAVVHHGGGSTRSDPHQTQLSIFVMRDSLHKFFLLHHGRLYAVAYRMTTLVVSLMRYVLLRAALLLTLHRSERLRHALNKWAAVLRWVFRMRPPLSAGEVTVRQC